MEVTYEWMKGAPFSQIMKMTSIFEGSIVRCMRRLDELLKQMSQAAKAIGNTELENKFAEGHSFYSSMPRWTSSLTVFIG
jgi:ATP-dependent RNA helicase DOB1